MSTGPGAGRGQSDPDGRIKTQLGNVRFEFTQPQVTIERSPKTTTLNPVNADPVHQQLSPGAITLSMRGTCYQQTLDRLAEMAGEGAKRLQSATYSGWVTITSSSVEPAGTYDGRWRYTYRLDLTTMDGPEPELPVSSRPGDTTVTAAPGEGAGGLNQTELDTLKALASTGNAPNPGQKRVLRRLIHRGVLTSSERTVISRVLRADGKLSGEDRVALREIAEDNTLSTGTE